MTSEQATGNGRTQAAFEDYPGCPNPPPPRLQSPWDPAVPEQLGLRKRSFTRGAVRAAFLLSGFAAFHRKLARSGDAVAPRGPHRPAPSPRSSAVQALADGPGTDPFLRGASLLAAVWSLHDEIRGGRFRADAARGQELESRSYLNLMGVSILSDGGRFRLFKTASTSRFLVMARRRQYVVDLDEGGGTPSVATLRAALEQVWERSGPPDAPLPDPVVGMLTCLPGEPQIAAFGALCGDPANRATLEVVKHAFVTVCLELDRFPETDAEAARWAIAGDFGNRWMYGGMQIVVFGNGKACQVGNPHCYAPGNVMMRIAATLWRRGAELARAGGGQAGPVTITEARWKLDQVDFGAVQKELGRIVDRDQQATFDIPGIGRAALGRAGLRPVEFFTVALQHAVHRLTGKIPLTCQFVSTASYRYGTFGTAVVSTPEVAALLEALRDPATSPDALRRLYAAAGESQRSACRIEREQAGIGVQLGWFLREAGGVRGRFGRGVLNALWSRVGRPTNPRVDIMVSHPTITEGVPVVGRPGIRLPNLGCFGMNYQIFEDHIRLTLMPGAWKIPNETLVAELEASLRDLAQRVGEPSADREGAAV